jgi:putative nucleotidyltransferase with HDIG domain
MRSLTQFSAVLQDMNRAVRLWAVGLWLAALGVVAVLGVTKPLSPWWALLGLSFVAAVAERQSVALARNIEMSVSFLPCPPAAVAFGPLTAAIVGGVANLADFRPPYGRWIVYTPARALTGAGAGYASLLVAPNEPRSFAPILFASLVAAVVNIALDGAFNAATLTVRGTGSGIAFARTLGPLFALSVPLYVPLVALLVFGYRAYSIWVVAMFLLPAVALQRVIHLYQEQRETAVDLANANEQLARANLSFAIALVATLDARDRYTAGHSAAVAIYSRDIAERMGLNAAEQQLAHVCGLVHDIGKVGLPAGLLEKAGALTLDERRQMEMHSQIGERILGKVEDYSEIARIVRHHHERVDGNGYPDGLLGTAIPIISRIIAVADAYNAMTSDRPYRDAMPSRVARLRLAQAVESQFDTSVVAAFEAILAGASETYRSGIREDFTLPQESEEVGASVVRVA